ncbi:MAG: DUF1761 domain-containing protein [Bacteroidia bacterium]|nr:DUF1761 domain-containing protein [Bacteroidia bacterium]
MVKINFLMTALAALFPLVLGFIWYNPKVFGKAWMNSAGLTEDKLKGGNMILIFILTYVFSFMIAFTLNFITVHQWGFQSLVMGDKDVMVPGSEANNLLTSVLTSHETTFRTFKHGALHGTIFGLLTLMPFFAINAMFERKGFKYVAINVGYWTICCAVMGGIVCQLM